MFAGGGHVRNPYQTGVLKAFENRRLTGRPLKPATVGLPLPKDLAPSDRVGFWGQIN